MKHISLRLLIPLLFLSGCGRLETLLYEPPQTAADWLASQPYSTIAIGGQTLTLMQPTSTLFVYALGVLAVAIGVSSWRNWHGQHSRRWWGAALIFWGAGALLAGTSYEGLSYHFKCAGRDSCLWTTWWEVGYLILSAASINAMVMAQAYACANGRLRRRLIGYGLINMGVYTTAVLLGALIPVKFLISFEFLLLATAPSIVGFIILNGWRYQQFHQRMDAVLLGTWLLLGVVIGLYFLYYALDITPWLWGRGIWFSDNDILHLGLIGWMLYIFRILLPEIEDLSS